MAVDLAAFLMVVAGTAFEVLFREISDDSKSSTDVTRS